MTVKISPYMDLVKKAQQAHKAANFQAAMLHYREAIQYYPSASQAYIGLAVCHSALRNFVLARESIDQALELGTDVKTADWLWLYRAFCCRELGHLPEAINSMEGVKNRGNTWKYCRTILIPAIYDSSAHIAQVREQLIDDLRVLDFDYNDSFAPLFTHFYLAYQGYPDDVEIHRLIYSKLAPFYPKKILLNQSKKRPIKRVGFISANLNTHSVGHCYSRMFKTLAERSDQDKIQYKVYTTHEATQDQVTKEISSHIPVTRLPASITDARKLIAYDGLDLLIYTDLGMDVMTWCMAFTRLARYQACMSGHPVSTGMDSIDFYISAENLHGPGWNYQFNEKVITPKHIVVDYPFPEWTDSISKADLLLPEDKNIYSVPMVIFKVHPDFDGILAGILQRDPDGIVIMFKFGDTALHMGVMKRFWDKYPELANRVYFRDWLKPDAFLSFLKHSDVVLDTPYFGGGNTTYLSLAVGTPVVTMHPTSLKDASTAGLYLEDAVTNDSGLYCCIANTDKEYVQKAVDIATDKQFQWLIRETILTNRGTWFENTSGSHDLCEWMATLLHV